MNENITTNMLMNKAAGGYFTAEFGNGRHVAATRRWAFLYLVGSFEIFVEHLFVAFRHYRTVHNLVR